MVPEGDGGDMIINDGETDRLAAVGKAVGTAVGAAVLRGADATPRRGRRTQRWLAGIGWALLVGASAQAADLPVPAAPPMSAAFAPPPSDWRVQVTLYGWATALSGNVGVRDLPTRPVDVSFSDLVSNLDGALMGAIVANNTDWLFYADLVVARFSHGSLGGPVNGTAFDFGLDQTIATVAVGRMLPTGTQKLDVAGTVGLRYVTLSASASASPLLLPLTLSRSQRQDWFDPTVGFVVRYAFDPHWVFNGIIDIGGFGVGSDLSSQGYAGLGYFWTKNLSTAIGYKYLYENYMGPGATTGHFRYDTVTHGPSLSVGWTF